MSWLETALSARAPSLEEPRANPRLGASQSEIERAPSVAAPVAAATPARNFRRFMNRRKFLAGVAAATGAATLGARSISDWLAPRRGLARGSSKLGALAERAVSSHDMPTTCKDRTHYHN